MVIANRHRNTAIIVWQTDRVIKIVEMQAGPLAVRRIDEEELTAEWGELVGYPVEKAICKFLGHEPGLTKGAKDALEALLINSL